MEKAHQVTTHSVECRGIFSPRQGRQIVRHHLFFESPLSALVQAAADGTTRVLCMYAVDDGSGRQKCSADKFVTEDPNYYSYCPYSVGALSMKPPSEQS